MDLLDSKNVHTRIRKRTVALAVFINLYVTTFTLGIWLIFLTLFGLITSALLRKDIDEAKSSASSFNKTFPFKYFGQVFGHFQHIFHHAENRLSCRESLYPFWAKHLTGIYRYDKA